MNLGQLTSLIHCNNCGVSIEIYPSQDDINCSVCGANNNLKMRNLTNEEEKSYQEGLEEISTPTGVKLFND